MPWATPLLLSSPCKLLKIGQLDAPVRGKFAGVSLFGEPPRTAGQALWLTPLVLGDTVPVRDAKLSEQKPLAIRTLRVRVSKLGSRHNQVSPETSSESRASDAALIGRLVLRDEGALAVLYDRYAGVITSVLRRILRDDQAAEEILQDIFFQLWNTASRFDSSRGSLPAWLVVIARNRAISRLRRHNPAAGDALMEGMAVSPLNLESAAARQQLVERVKASLENLPKEQRAAVELAFFEGLTHSEIAARTGDPLGTVKTRLRSALETLRRTLHSAARSANPIE